MDLLKTVLALSTGAVAFFFNQVSSKSSSASNEGDPLILGALVCFATAALFGLVGWFILFRLYFVSAKALMAGYGSHFEIERKFLKKVRNLIFLVLSFAFAAGVVLSTIATAFRLPVAAVPHACFVGLAFAVVIFAGPGIFVVIWLVRFARQAQGTS